MHDSLFTASELQQLWLDALLARHQEALTFQELRRCVKALSVSYTVRRHHLDAQKPLTRGKRAAFCAYYTPLHIELIARALGAMGAAKPRNLLDLGAGTGAATLAFLATVGIEKEARLIDTAPWALDEARIHLSARDCPHLVRNGLWRAKDLDQLGRRDACVLAFFVNELLEQDREKLWEALLRAQTRGAHAYLIEPISRGITPWWGAWVKRALPYGGVASEGRWPINFPANFSLLGRAAGLDHRILTARMWHLPPARG